tara:strand:- start:543 stop:1043 length:501 start_codon:yes stop_codon:yes gene_type:complete
MADAPPDHFLCPISREVMREPIMIEHEGHPYWFDRKCLEAHAKTRYKDYNPLTNLPGFSKAPRASDDALRKQIEESAWAPSKNEADEDICITEEETDPYTHYTSLSDIANVVITSEFEVPGIYNLLVTADIVPRSFLASIRRLDDYIVDVFEDYVNDGIETQSVEL